MKAFEKWYNELSMREDEVDFTIPTYESYKRGWKAALEMVMNNVDGPLGEYNNNCDCARMKVQKELEIK